MLIVWKSFCGIPEIQNRCKYRIGTFERIKPRSLMDREKLETMAHTMGIDYSIKNDN